MLTVASIFQGVALSKIGYATPFMVVGAAIGTISAGLFYTFDIDTSVGRWVGYQILCGFAVGGAFQTSIAVVQVNATPEDMSSVTAMVQCESLPGLLMNDRVLIMNYSVFQMIGGSFTLAASQSGFNNRLIHTLRSSVPDINPATVLATGATQIRTAFTSAQVPDVVAAYMAGLKVVFAITAGTFAFATFIAFCASWKRLYPADSKKDAGAD